MQGLTTVQLVWIEAAIVIAVGTLAIVLLTMLCMRYLAVRTRGRLVIWTLALLTALSASAALVSVVLDMVRGDAVPGMVEMAGIYAVFAFIWPLGLAYSVMEFSSYLLGHGHLR